MLPVRTPGRVRDRHLPAKTPGPERQGGKPRAAPLGFSTPDTPHLGLRLPFSKKKQKKMCSALREGSLW